MLSERIRELRKASGMTQVALAKELGVTKQCVSNWENGNIQPSVDMLVRLALCFGVSTQNLDLPIGVILVLVVLGRAIAGKGMLARLLKRYRKQTA